MPDGGVVWTFCRNFWPRALTAPRGTGAIKVKRNVAEGGGDMGVAVKKDKSLACGQNFQSLNFVAKRIGLAKIAVFKFNEFNVLLAQ